METAFSEIRERVLAPMLEAAAFDGFTVSALQRAARAAGVSTTELAAAFPAGIEDFLGYWSAEADAAIVAALADPAAADLRIRLKVARAVEARLDYLAADKEAARRASATLALPGYAALGASLVWRTADTIWRAMGDRSTDLNFYSKRAILSGVWLSTFTRWLADDEPNWPGTRAFLADRIGDVMQFEKLKARIASPSIDPSAVIAALARLRYPLRRGRTVT